MNRTIKQRVSGEVGLVTEPMIVVPGVPSDTISEWLKTAVTMERMMVNLKAIKGGEPAASDAEA